MHFAMKIDQKNIDAHVVTKEKINMQLAMKVKIRIGKHLCINVCSNLLKYVHILDMTLCIQMFSFYGEMIIMIL